MPDIVIIEPGQSAKLDPTTSGFAHGFGLFETIRFSDGALYFWDAHWQRLALSAEAFGLALPEPEAVLAGIRSLLQISELSSATIKLSLLKEATDSRLYIYTRPPMEAPTEIRLRLDLSCPIFSRSVLSGHKTHNYMESMHLLTKARAEGDYDLLRVSSEGHLAETSSANFFFVLNGQIHTPSLQTGILPGVTRSALLADKALNVQEGLYQPEQLALAEAAFITNATHGIIVAEQIVGPLLAKAASTIQTFDLPSAHPLLEQVRVRYAESVQDSLIHI